MGVGQARVRSPLLLRAKRAALGAFLCAALICKVRLMKMAGSLQGLTEGVRERPGTWKMLSRHGFPSSPAWGRVQLVDVPSVRSALSCKS